MSPAPHPRTIPPASDDDAMWEQFAAVMEQGANDSRYLGLRAILLGLFSQRRNTTMKQKQDQFTSLNDAVQFVVRAGIAGVEAMPIDDTNGFHNDKSGVYLPPWTDADNAPEPQWGEKRQFCLRLKQAKPDGSHVEGFVIGLYLQMAIGHAGQGAPPNYDYAIDFLKKEAAAQLAEASQ